MTNEIKITHPYERAFSPLVNNSSILKDFGLLLQRDVNAGIFNIKDTYYALVDTQKEPDLPMGAAGGPMTEGDIRTFYNLIGSVYPFLVRDQKDNVLNQLFRIWELMNMHEVTGLTGVSGHTPGIREPLLLADIYIAKPIYWPGLDEGKDLIRKHGEFVVGDRYQTLRDQVLDSNGLFLQDKVVSDFLVGYTLLRKDMHKSTDRYVDDVNPLFLDRLMRGIVGMRFGVEDAISSKVSAIEKGTRKLEELLPEILHKRITPLREAGGWADYKKFRK